MNTNRITKRSRAVLLVAALALVLVLAAPAAVHALDSGWCSVSYYYNASHAYDLNRVYSQNNYSARIGEYDDYTGSAYFSFGSSFVPANAYITGIEVGIDCYCPCDDTQFNVAVIDNGVSRGVRSFYTPQSESNNYSYVGGAWDNWGYTGWTPAKINSTNFRVQLGNTDDDEYVMVDHIQIKVHYTIGHVVTNAPTGITAHTASIGGFFDSFVDPTHANTKGLELWNTAGGPVISMSEAAGGDSGTMQASLTDLLSNSQYACKAFVWYDASPGDLNLDDNVTYGATHYFITPPEVTTQAATSVASHSVVLNGYTNTDGSRAVSNGFYISSTADTAEELKSLGLQLGNPGEGSFSKAISSLQANTTYYYLAASYNLRDGALNFGYGEVMSFTTLPDPPVVTAHPANRTITYGANTTFSASATGLPAPSVTWQVSSDAGATWAPVAGDVYAISTSGNEATGVVSSTLTLTRPIVTLSGCRYRALFINWVLPEGVASNAATLTVNRANASIVVSGWSGVYDGTYHGATLASATGVGSEDLAASVTIAPTPFKDVPGGSVNWSFSNPNYNPQSGNAAINITPAVATVIVTGWSGVYDGTYHGATLASATGVGSEDLAASVTIAPTSFKDVPGGSVNWSFSNPNYSPQSGSVDVTITPADVFVRIRSWSGVYDGEYHGIIFAFATGVGGEDLSSSMAVGGATYKDVPGGSIPWSFSHLNYLPENGLAYVNIRPAIAMIVVNGWSGTYDGAYHGAALSSATGVSGEDLSASVTVGTETYKDVPGGLVHWTFSNPNYVFQESDAQVSISKANLNVTALDKTSQYSDSLRALDCIITGFIGSDDASVISGEPVLVTTAASTSQAGTYAITVDVSGLSATNYDFTPVSGTYTITREDATVFFENTLTSQLVATPGGSAPSFGLTVDFKELIPDSPAESAAAGDISKLLTGTVRITLTPVGPGGSYVSSDAAIVWNLAGGYNGIATATVTFPAGIPVNTYEIKVELLDNPYYQLGDNASVFTIYDPSLGFTTGGGWFYWPDSADPANGYPGDRTNFGYTMQYGKKGTNLKGNLLIIRHLANGDLYRIKSNALDSGSLALGTTTLPMGWAAFSGKCTFTAICAGVETTYGNVPFRVYVEDRNEPGILADRFWIETTGYEALTITGPAAENAVCLQGGNIFVPHAPAKK